MAGPWEDFQTAQPAAGPWQDFQQAQPPEKKPWEDFVAEPLAPAESVTAPPKPPEEIAAAPSVFDEIKAGRFGSAALLARDAIGQALAPTQETAALQVHGEAGKSLLGTTEPMVANPEDNAATRLGKATVNVGNRFMAGLTTPEMMPLWVLGGTPALGRAVTGAFAGDIIANIPEVVNRIKQAENTKPWSQERWETALDTVLQTSFLKGLSEHAIRGQAPVAAARPAEPGFGIGDIQIPQQPVAAEAFRGGEIPSETQAAAAEAQAAAQTPGEAQTTAAAAQAAAAGTIPSQPIPFAPEAVAPAPATADIIAQTEAQRGGEISGQGQRAGEGAAAQAAAAAEEAAAAGGGPAAPQIPEAIQGIGGGGIPGPGEGARGVGPSLEITGGPAEGTTGEGIRGAPRGDRLGPGGGPVGEPLSGGAPGGGAGDAGRYGYPPTGEPVAGGPAAGEVLPPPAALGPQALPRDLAGAKPRYNYGSKSFGLDFASDVDKAAYIAAQATKSKADARYVQFARDATGLSEADIRAHGQDIRARIKEQARTSTEPVLSVPAATARPFTRTVEPTTGRAYALPNEVRTAFTESPTGTPELESLQRDIKKELYNRGVAGLDEPAPRLVRMDSAAARAAEGRSGAVSRAEALAKAFGLDVTWFRSDRPVPISGTRGPGELLLNVDSLAESPLHIVAAHELTHDLAATNPPLYRVLRDTLAKVDRPAFGRYAEVMAKRGYRISEIPHEYVADFVAETLQNPARFAQVLGDNPSLARRVLTHISDFINRTLRKLGLRKDASATGAATDLRAAQQQVMQVLGAFRAGRQTGLIRGGRQVNFDNLPVVAETGLHAGEKPQQGISGRSFGVDSDTARADFATAVEQAASAHKYGAAVEIKDPAFYQNKANKLFLTRDGRGGAAVTAGGDLVSVFKHPDSTENMMPLLREAASHASTLDAFDLHSYLPELYAELGFRPIARVAFDPAQAPVGWDHALMDEPDIVLMAKTADPRFPDVSKNYARIKDRIPLVDYDRARQLQAEAAAKAQTGLIRGGRQFALDEPPKRGAVGFTGFTRAGGAGVNKPDSRISTRTPWAVKATENPHSQVLEVGIDTLLGNKEKTKSMAARLTPWLPKELRDRNPTRQVENAIEFFKRNKLTQFQMGQRYPWFARALNQYEGYNIHAHALSRESGFTPEQIMGAESALSPQRPPDGSFSMAERLIGVMRGAGDTRWDPAFTKAARAFETPVTAQQLQRVKGKTYSQLTDPIDKAIWARTYDNVKNPASYHMITPEGARGDLARNATGEPSAIQWPGYAQIAKGIKALEGARLTDILTSHKISSYHNSKVAPLEPNGDYVSDTHDAAAGWMNSIPANHPLIAEHFGGQSNGMTGDQGMYALQAEAGRRAAAEVGVTPKQFQAGIWSHQRGFLSPRILPENAVAKIQQIWKDASRGKLTEQQARDATIAVASDAIPQVADPAWARQPAGPGGAGIEGTQAPGIPGELPQAGGPAGAAGPGAGGRAAPGAAQERGVSGRQFALDEPPSQASFEAAANDKEKMRGHIATVQRMSEVSPDVKARVESMYSPITLRETTAQARATVDKLGLENAHAQFMNSRKAADASTMALGHEVALRFDALGAGDPVKYDLAAEVRNRMAEKSTGPAQALWFLSTIEKTSPEGLVREAQKVVADQIKSDPAKQAALQHIEKLRQQVQNLPEGPAKRIAVGQALEQLKRVNVRGQMLPLQKINRLIERNRAGSLTPEQLGEALAKGLKVPRFGAADRQKILDAQRKYAEAEASGNHIMAMRRGGEMLDAVYDKVPRSFWSKVRATAVLSMITHLKLPVRIGISEGMQATGRMGIDAIKNFTTGGDLARVFTGKRTITADQIQAAAEGLRAPDVAFKTGYREARQSGLGRVPSFKEGARTMLDMAAMTTRGMHETTDIKGRSHIFSNRFGRLAEDTVTMLHNVIPYGFWNAGFKSSLVRQMRLAGAEMPTEEMVAQARLDANKAIFQNDTLAGKTANKIREGLDFPTKKITGGKYGFGTATLPFTRIPAALLTEGATWSPVGFIRGMMELGRPLIGESIKPGEVADSFLKAAIGTGSLGLTGYWLAKLGVLTGAKDENKDVDALRRSLNWGAYRINLSELKRRMLSGNWWTPSRLPQNGDVVSNYNWLEPAAIPVAMGADAWHSRQKGELDLKRGKLTSNAILSAANAGVQSLVENPMLQGLKDVIQSGQMGGAAGVATTMLANVPGNFMPSIARQTMQKLDNTVRETSGGSDLDQEVNRFLAQLPGVSQRYPANYNALGEAQRRYNYGANSVLNIFLNPANVQTFKANPGAAEMLRLYEDTGTTRGLPSAPGRAITVNGQQVQLDNEQLATYKRYVGQNYSAVAARLLAAPNFVKLPEKLQQDLLAEAASAVNTSAKVDLFGQKPVKATLTPRGVSVSALTPQDIIALIRGRQMGLNVPVSPANP